MPKVVDAEQRRSEITDAAARVIARSGIESATMRQVATEAGWTTGAVTHYFTDKRDLLLTTFQASLARRRSQRPESESSSPADRLWASLEGALPLDDSRRRHWLVTLACCTQAGTDELLEAAQRDAYREFRDHVAGVIDAGRFTPRHEAVAAAERLIAAADGIAIQALFDPDGWAPGRQVAVLRTVLESLLPTLLTPVATAPHPAP
jgi:TetR/AcrR family transcriptional regulator, transcriptional repressor of bet genes